MKIQKRKFLSNLSRIRIFQQSHSQFQRLLAPFQFLHVLFLLSFMVIRSNVVSGNKILSFIKQVHQDTLQIAFLPFILCSLLIIISVFIILPLLFLSRKEHGLEFTEYKNNRSRFLLRCAAVCSFIFNYLAPLLLMTIISGIQVNNSSEIFINFIYFVAILSCQAVIVLCREYIFYSYKLAVLSFSLVLLPPFQAYLFISAVTLYCLRTKFNSFEHQTGYFLTLLIAFLLMVGEQTQTIIGELHFILLLILVVAIRLFYQPSYTLLSMEQENDFLLKIVERLSKEEELRWQQIMQIVYISQGFQSKCQSLSKEDFHSSQKFDPSSFKHITKSDVLKLLRLKLEIEVKLNPNNPILSIQRFECQLLDKPFSILTLYQIEKLNLAVQERCNYEDICRMEALIEKLEVNFLKSEDEINSSLIFRIEKQLEQFYICIGEGIEQLLALWKTILVREVSEEVFDNSIAKMIRLETESLKILQQLSKYKDMNFQKKLFNYWRKITNVNINSYFSQDTPKTSYKLMDTKFLLISNGIIEDASHTIAKKITFNKEESLIGLKISQVLYDFYNIFLERELNTIISISDVHKEIVIPFRIVNHEKRFIPSSCTFKILPNLSQGVKYIINFVDRKEDMKKYALYCMESDTIEGFSQTFFEKFKIDESLLPEIISGQDVFNTAISGHIIEEQLSIGMTIRCELKFTDLRKQSKSIRANRHSIPLMVTIRDIYQAKKLNYVLLELVSREETAILSAHDTIKQFVADGGEEPTNLSYGSAINETFCKIRNPLESVIDDKLSRINVGSRISYFKIVLGLILIAILLLFGALVQVRMDTTSTGEDLNHQLDVVSSTNMLIQKLYLLFYQYYQYYQIKNFPEQILSIQHYNTSALNSQYKEKANANIVDLLPLILKNQNPQQLSSYSLKYNGYSTIANTDVINLIDFLQAAKSSLATNQPAHLVQNYHLVYTFIASFVPFNNEVLQQFRIRVKTWNISLFVVLMLTCLSIRAIHLRVTLFKWNILKVYSEISGSQVRKYSAKLEDFINLLVRIKYYNLQNGSTASKKVGRRGFSTKDTFGDELVRAQLNSSSQAGVKGVKFRSTCSQLLSNNFVFLVPMVIAGFLWLYYQMVVSYDHQSDTVLDYFSELQDLTVLILQKGTQFFQAAMEATLPSASMEQSQQQGIFTLPTRLHQQLPAFFQDYKKVENSMLNYNLCDYSYLNTGSLYRGINCAMVLDGMMNRGFTETYAFLLQHIEALRGAALPALGAQLRPSAQYPFFMEVCYARRTINNMLTVVQSRFAVAVNGFLEAKQTSLHSAVALGFALLPLALGVFWMFARRLRSDCEKAIKCFRILPRSFIMKISISKRLNNLGALQQIELIAP